MIKNYLLLMVFKNLFCLLILSIPNHHCFFSLKELRTHSELVKVKSLGLRKGTRLSHSSHSLFLRESYHSLIIETAFHSRNSLSLSRLLTLSLPNH